MRPVVFFFGSGDSIQFSATRRMLMALAESPALWREELGTIEGKLGAAQRDLSRANDVLNKPQELHVRRDRELIDRVVQIIETDLGLEQDRIFRLRLKKEEEKTDAMRAEEAELGARQVMLNRLKAGFQLKPADLAGAELAPSAKEMMQRVIQRLSGGDNLSDQGLIRQLEARKAELNERIDLYQWLRRSASSSPAKTTLRRARSS
jgi:hypothetical protein